MANTIRVIQGGQSTGAVVVKKAPDLTVQGLKNVDSRELLDGYTLIYDADTQKFVTSPVTAVAAAIDGGTY